MQPEFRSNAMGWPAVYEMPGNQICLLMTHSQAEVKLLVLTLSRPPYKVKLCTWWWLRECIPYLVGEHMLNSNNTC